MSYVDGLLTHDERIVRRERQHWLWPVLEGRWAVLALGIWILSFLASAWLSDTGISAPFSVATAWIALIAFIVGVGWLARSIIVWRFQEYVVTSHRAIQAGGVLNKYASDTGLEKINDADIHQPLVGRLLGFGDLEVMTASETGIDRFRMLTDPIDFKKAMLEAKHALEYEMARPRTPSPPIRADAPAPAGRPAGAPAPDTARPAARVPAEAPLTTAAPVVIETPLAAPTATHPAPSAPEDVTKTLAALADLRDRGAITSEEFEAKKRELLERL